MSSPGSALRVEIVALRRRTGAVGAVRMSVAMDDLEITAARVRDGRVDVDLSLESVTIETHLIGMPTRST